MQVQEIYDIEILIDGLNIFENSGITFKKATLYEDIVTHIPSCELNLIVPIAFMDSRSIVDGAKIDFEITCPHFNIRDRYTYRLYCIEEVRPQTRFVELKLSGVLDFYDGYTSANKYNKYAATSDIMLDIALANKVDILKDATNDTQLWIAGENNVYQFMEMMTERAWIDETSAMVWFLDRYKRLAYKNLTYLFDRRSDKIYTFVQSEKVDQSQLLFGYTSANASIMAGRENIYNGGYGGENYFFDLLSYSQKNVSAKKVVAESNLININKEISRGLYDNFYPFDVGNFHPNYHLAKIQNQRILSTYSTYVTLTSQFFQPYRLGQIVHYVCSDAQDMNCAIKALSGLFMINAIKIDISLQSVSSMIELAMQGLNGQALTQEVY